MPATGTCFEEAFNLASKLADDSTIRIVHGYVTSRRPDGLRYRHSHAWVEDISCNHVFDFSNGNELLFSKEKFYAALAIEQTVEYSPTEARYEMLKHGNYGPWVEWIKDGE